MGYVVIPLLLQLGLMCSLCLLLQAQLIVMSHLSQHHLILLSLSNLQQNCKCTQYFSASGNWCTSEHWPADSLCALITPHMLLESLVDLFMVVLCQDDAQQVGWLQMQGSVSPCVTR
jgi:hypothetical protein